MIWQNKRRERAEGLEGSQGGSGIQTHQTSDGQTQVDSEAYEDITDYNSKGFRYRL